MGHPFTVPGYEPDAARCLLACVPCGNHRYRRLIAPNSRAIRRRRRARLVLDPLADRLERLGLNRLMATLVILALFIVVVVVLIYLAAPFLIEELVAFIERSPAYVKQLQALATDPSRPWLRKLIGEGLGHAEQSLGDLATLAAGWLSTVVRSVWSGGQALISIFSLSVVTPIVACYLLYDWHRAVAAIDSWVPVAHRDTVRALAREIDHRSAASCVDRSQSVSSSACSMRWH